MNFTPTPFKRGAYLFVLALFILAGLPACNSLKSIEYRGISDWDLKPKSFAESKLSAQVHIFNPNSYGITVKRIEADIAVNGSSWGVYKLDSVFVLPAQSDYTFPIDLLVKNSHLLSGALTLASGTELPYQLKGKIKGAYRNITAEVPFEHSGRFSDADIKF